LISTGAIYVNVPLPRHLEPPALVYAAQRNQKELVEILLRSNARINDTNESGTTACHAAVANGHVVVLAEERAGSRPSDSRRRHASENCNIKQSRTLRIDVD
jgi:ankyrin repeat protein